MSAKTRLWIKSLLLLLHLFTAWALWAQSERKAEGGTATFGIKAGINFAELWGEDAIPESDRKTGYSFGGFAAFKLSESFKFQPEAIWSLQGETSESSGRYKISYLNIPLMCKWTRGAWYAELGPQLGFLTVSTSKSVPEEIRLENFETFDFSINLGLGVTVFEDWSLGLRYSEGLTNIAPDSDLRNSVIYLGIAVALF